MFRLLLNFWFAPIFGMFFATAPVVGDMGGSDGASSDAGGDGGDSGGDGADAGGGDAGGPPEGTGDLPTGEPGPEAGQDPNALIDSGDGRKIPQKYSELFKTDKALKEMFFSAQALRKVFPGGVKDAVELAKGVDELGGMDGIQQLKSDLEVHNQDAQLFEGDPAKWAEQGFTENPEAALKAFAHSLEYIGQNHADQYDYLMSRVVVNTLDQGPVHDIYGFLAGLKDNPQAQELAKKLSGFYNGIKSTAAKVPEKKVDAQQKKLDADRDALTKKEQELRNKSINSEATPYLNKGIDASVDAAAKAAGFDIAAIRKDQPNRYAKFASDVRQTIHKSVLADEGWLKRYESALNSGDTAKCVRMLNTRHDQAINGTGTQAGVVKSVFEEWFGVGKKPAATAPDRPRPAGASGNGSTLHVAKMPAPAEIDYSDSRTRIIDQTAVLKTGKVVSWAR